MYFRGSQHHHKVFMKIEEANINKDAKDTKHIKLGPLRQTYMRFRKNKAF